MVDPGTKVYFEEYAAYEAYKELIAEVETIAMAEADAMHDESRL